MKPLFRLFQIDGHDLELAPGQRQIFEAIVSGKTSRLTINCCTQYGKSLTVALAVILLACIRGKKIALVAPTEEKARIIMRYILEHIGDSLAFSAQLEKDTKLDRLKQETNKQRLILRNGGGMYVISAQAANSKKSFEAAMGEGADVVLLDEAALIGDDTEATIYRMIAGRKHGVYVKIGNPFRRNHFYTSCTDPTYKHITIDYIQALKEGRYTEEFVAEARKKPRFDTLYECKFPEESEFVEGGYRRLFPMEMIQAAFTDTMTEEGEKHIGFDVAAGGADSSVIVMRDNLSARVLKRWQDPDTMSQIAILEELVEKYGVPWENVSVDDTGVGYGLSNRLKEKGYPIDAARVGSQAVDSKRYVSQKAERFFLAHEWLVNGGRLIADNGFKELNLLCFKEDSGSRLKIEPKEEMRAREHVGSPDTADAFMLTFTGKTIMTSNDWGF